jgi:uncharacterized protein (DUF4415 family)
MKELTMFVKPAVVFVVASALAAPALAQEREAQPKPAAAQAGSPERETQAKPAEPKAAAQEAQPAARRELTQAINVRIDVTITDQTSAEQGAVKTLTLLAADGSWTRVRSEGFAWTTGGQYPISLRVDARPRLLQAEKVHLELVLDYKPTAPEPKPGASATTLSESCDIVLESGKPIVISQAADPNSDRKVKLEVKATILR